MKRTVTALNSSIDAYSALSTPLAIDPTLDGGLKKDILETLNNKAANVPYLKLTEEPSATMILSDAGADGDFFILSQTPCLLFQKVAGAWNAVDKSNDMFFYCDGGDGVRRYYSFSDDLSTAIKVHELDTQAPEGAVKITPQAFTTAEKTQARTNIDAASQAYIDNAIAALKASGAIGSSVAGSIMPWAGTVESIPTDWAVIPIAQTWYSKALYPDLYAALGGESNVWGLTEFNFSLPFMANGSFISKATDNVVISGTGGAATVTLTTTQIPSHAHSVNDVYFAEQNAPPYLHGNGYGGAVSGSFPVAAITEMTGSVTKSVRGSGDTDASNDHLDYWTHDTASAGGGLSHENLPPYVLMLWIIKLKNSGVDPAESDDIVEIKLIKQSPLAYGSVGILAGTYIKNIYLKKATGNPIVQISDGYGLLINTETAIESVVQQAIDKNYPTNDTLIFTVTGGTIDILITKLNL